MSSPPREADAPDPPGPFHGALGRLDRPGTPDPSRKDSQLSTHAAPSTPQARALDNAAKAYRRDMARALQGERPGLSWRDYPPRAGVGRHRIPDGAGHVPATRHFLGAVTAHQYPARVAP